MDVFAAEVTEQVARRIRWRRRFLDLTQEEVARRAGIHRAEGKSNKEAFRCLKRHLVRVVWRTLREPLAAASGGYADARRPGSSPIDAKVCAPSASSRSPLPSGV